MIGIDETKAVVRDGALVSSGIQAEYVVVPAEIRGQTIDRIEKNAISGNILCRLELQEGIRRASHCLTDNAKLLELCLPASLEAGVMFNGTRNLRIVRMRRDMTRNEWNVLRTGLPLPGGMRLVNADPQQCAPVMAMRSLFYNGCAMAHGLTAAHAALFASGEMQPAKEAFYTGGLTQLPLDPAYQGLSELETVQAMIAGGNMGCSDPQEERMADDLVRQGKDRAMVRTTITLLHDEPVSVNEDGSIRAQLVFRRGFFFCPSLCRVANDGKDYYVYRRNYLTDERHYARMDICVMNERGVETDSAVVEKIYSRYRLMALL